MTEPPLARRTGLRAALTDPALPVVLLAAGAVAAAVQGTVLTWAILGGLAGHTLSGSV